MMCCCLLTPSAGVAAVATEAATGGVITVSGAWALYPMAVRWAEEYQKIHQEVKINVVAGGAGKGMADALAGVVDLGMVSRDVHPMEMEKGAWWVSVTEDAVVPIINAQNPVAERLLSTGVKQSSLSGIWVDESVKDWATVAGTGVSQPVRAYVRSDSCGAAETWAAYLGKKQEDLVGVGVYGDPGLVEAVRRDVYGIGFNNINYVYDAKTKRQIDGIRVIPLDINGNGKIDKEEDFYGSRDDITKAIASGRYPSPPARYLHFVSQGRPSRGVVATFLKWVLTDGQRYVSESGYINMSREKLNKELSKL